MNKLSIHPNNPGSPLLKDCSLPEFEVYPLQFSRLFDYALLPRRRQNASEQRQDRTEGQPLPHPRRHPRRVFSIPPRQPLRAGLGDRPIPGEERRASGRNTERRRRSSGLRTGDSRNCSFRERGVAKLEFWEREGRGERFEYPRPLQGWKVVASFRGLAPPATRSGPLRGRDGQH